MRISIFPLPRFLIWWSSARYSSCSRSLALIVFWKRSKPRKSFRHSCWVRSDPTNRHPDRANSLTDRPNVFNGNLVYTPEWKGHSQTLRRLVNGNRIAILAVMQSGDVFNIGSNLILNGDPSTPSAFQRPLFIGRNTLRGPWISEINVRYSRLFPLGERFRLEFIAESTNVFNHTNVVG